MEGIPFRLAISLVLMAAIIGIVFYEVSVYTSFTKQKNFADDLLEIRNSMQTLVSVSDYGSFTRVHVVIPEGSNITFNNLTDNITAFALGELREYKAPGNILWNRTYGPGTYDLELYYGTPPFDPEKDNFTIAFN